MVWFVVLAACAPLPATDFASLDLPPAFTLDTHAPVTLRVIGAEPGVHLVVRLPDGTRLFSGDAALAERHPPTFRIPAGVTALHATTDRAFVVEVRGPLADLDLRGGR